jgi:multimeric flavodoxin WrbA
MAKISGIGMTVSIDDSSGSAHDVSNDLASLNFGTPQNLLTVTGLNKSAMERIIGLGDGTVSITGNAFNDAAGKLFDILKTRSGTRTVAITIDSNVLSQEMLISSVQFARNNDGSLVPTATFELQDGTLPTWA